MLPYHRDFVADPSGNVISNASVEVQTSEGVAAVLYGDIDGETTLPSNVLTTDDYGQIGFFAEPGTYRFEITPPGATASVSRENITLPVVSPTAVDVSFTQQGTGAVTRTVQDKLYEIISVLDFAVGDIGDGATSPDAAIASAVGTANRHVIFPAGTYKMGAQALCAQNVTVELLAGATLDIGALPVGAAAFKWAGTEGAEYPMSANAVAKSRLVNMSAANLAASGIVAGNWIRIGSNAVFDASRTSSKIGELIRVDSVNLGTGAITTETPLADGYLTADSATVSKVTLVEGAALIGKGRILDDKTSADSHIAVTMELCHRPLVQDVRFEGLSDRAVYLKDCIRHLVYGIHGDDFQASGTAYLVSVTNACQDGVVGLVTCRKVRHIFTTNNAAATKGIPRRCIFNGFTGEDTSYATGGSMGAGDMVDTHAAAEDIHYWNFTLRGSSGQGINAECRSGSIINGWIYGSIGIGLALHNQTDREGDWVLDNVHSYDSGGDGIKVTPVHAGFARLVMRNLSATDAAGVGIFIDGSASHDIGLRASNWDITRSASATASAYVINVNGGSIKGVHVQDPTQVGQTGLRLRDVTHLSVSQVTGRLASEAVGALVYFNATGAGTCSDCTIDNVVGESPAAVSSRGILLDNNARDITVGRVLRLDDFTTPISWGSGTGHVGGLMRGTLTTDPASLAAGATQTFNVTVPGVAVGDVASASFSAANVNINWFAEATGTGNVTVTQKNNSGGAIDLASGTIKVVAFKAG